MAEEKVQQLINALGANAELYRATYDAFIDNGFTNAQSLDLTKHHIMSHRERPR